MDSSIVSAGGVPARIQDFRVKVLLLEDGLKKFPQVDLPPKHYFLDGMYAREIFIPKGTILTGEIHRTEHLNIIPMGDIMIATEEGPIRVVAPCMMVSKPGIKKVGWANEDTIWITVHSIPNGMNDLDEIESVLIAKTYGELDSPGGPAGMIEGGK